MKTEIEVLKSRHAAASRHVNRLTTVKKAADAALRDATTQLTILEMQLSSQRTIAFNRTHPRAAAATSRLMNVSLHLSGRLDYATEQVKQVTHESPEMSKVSEATNVVEYSDSVAQALAAMLVDFDCCEGVQQATADALKRVEELDRAFTTVACQTKHKPEDVETLYNCLHQVADAVTSLVIMSNKAIARIGYDLVFNDEKSRATA